MSGVQVSRFIAFALRLEKSGSIDLGWKMPVLVLILTFPAAWIG